MSESLIYLLSGVAALVATITVAALRFEKRDVAAREAMWSALAARRGGAHHPGVWGRGGWRVSPRIEVVARGARVTVDTFRRSASENGEVFTRVRAPRARGGPLFEVCIPGLVATVGRVSLGGHDGFDRDFAVRTDAPGAVSAAWTPAARALLRQHFHGANTHVTADADGVTMRWNGESRDPAVLDAAIEIVADLARA